MPDYSAPFTCEAFISYCHADASVARQAHKALEEYHVPRFAKGFAGRRRTGRVFIDGDELRAGENLERKLDEIIKESKYLIVICSKGAAASS